MDLNDEMKNWQCVSIVRPPKKSSLSKDVVTTVSSGHISMQPQRPVHSRIVQNFIIVWLDPHIDDLDSNVFNKSVTELRRVVNCINVFIDVDQCVDFITDIGEEKILMIISDELGSNTLPLVHDIMQINSIYSLRKNELPHKPCTQHWSKVKGSFDSVTSMCKTLKQDAQKCDQDSISISFVSKSRKERSENLDELDPMFMYSQILKEILLTIDFDKHHIKNFTNYYRENFPDNAVQLNNIDEFEKDYDKHWPIWWYTHECCLYSMLNRALRMMEVDAIIKMGFFIRDLHHQITELHTKQFSSHYQSQQFTTYRGQGLSKKDFSELLATQGGLISFNNFLSTSKDQDVAIGYARSALANPRSMGIVFVMRIDPAIKSTPFASIKDVSYYQTEDEILFSMHTVFRIGNMIENDDNGRLWRVDLIQTEDNDSQLNALTKRMRDDIRGSKEWDKLGKLLTKLGQFSKAEELYRVLLEETDNEREQAYLYNQLGWSQKNQKKYDEAIIFYEKSLHIKYRISPENHSLLAISLRELGSVYEKMNQYSKALLYHEKALEIQLLKPSSDQFSLAFCYSDIGTVYEKMEEYEKAITFHEKAVEIRQALLPSSSLKLTYSYNSIGSVYEKMRDYSKAISFHEKALEIQKDTLPANHPDMAQSYSKIGFVYDKLGRHSTARQFHQSAVDIGRRSLPNDHPRLQYWRKNLEFSKRKCN